MSHNLTEKNKVAGIVSGNRVPVDSSCKSMDLYRVVDHKSGFSLYRGSRILIWKGSFGVMDQESSQFSEDSTCFHESNKSSQILSTIAQNESLKILICKSRNLRKNTFHFNFEGFCFVSLLTWQIMDRSYFSIINIFSPDCILSVNKQNK